MNEHWKHYGEGKKPDTKATLCMVSFIWNSFIGNSIGTYNRLVFVRVWGRGEQGVTAKGMRCLEYILGWWNVLELDSDDGCTSLLIYETPQNCTSKGELLWNVNYNSRKKVILYHALTPAPTGHITLGATAPFGRQQFLGRHSAVSH